MSCLMSSAASFFYRLQHQLETVGWGGLTYHFGKVYLLKISIGRDWKLCVLGSIHALGFAVGARLRL